MKKTFSFIITALLLCSCFGAKSGVKVSKSQFETVEKGKSTRAQVVQMFGRPQVIATLPDGQVQIVYAFGQSKINPATCIPIVGLFAHSQSVESVSASFTFDAESNLLTEKSFRSSGFSSEPLGK